jgi:hypothetical protein
VRRVVLWRYGERILDFAPHPLFLDVADRTGYATAWAPELVDVLGLTDAATGAVSTTRSPLDPLGLTDAATAGLTATVSLVDPLGLLDAATAGLGAFPVLEYVAPAAGTGALLVFTFPDAPAVGTRIIVQCRATGDPAADWTVDGTSPGDATLVVQGAETTSVDTPVAAMFVADGDGATVEWRFDTDVATTKEGAAWVWVGLRPSDPAEGGASTAIASSGIGTVTLAAVPSRQSIVMVAQATADPTGGFGSDDPVPDYTYDPGGANDNQTTFGAFLPTPVTDELDDPLLDETDDPIGEQVIAVDVDYSATPGAGVLLIAAFLVAQDIAWAPELADTLGLLDVADRTTAADRPLVDVLGLLDTATQTSVTDRPLVDVLGLVDSHAVTQPAGRALVDVLGLLDVRTVTQASGRTLIDPLGLTDARAMVQAFRRTLIDVLGLLDTPATQPTIGASIVDPLGLGDTVAVAFTRLAQIVDALAAVDGLTLAVTELVELVDQLGLSDAVTIGTTTSSEGGAVVTLTLVRARVRLTITPTTRVHVSIGASP